MLDDIRLKTSKSFVKFIQHCGDDVLAHQDTAFSKASQIPRSETLTDPVTNVTENNQIPLVLTFHPFNFKVRDLIRKNFHILKNDPETFEKP